MQHLEIVFSGMIQLIDLCPKHFHAQQCSPDHAKKNWKQILNHFYIFFTVCTLPVS